MSWKKEANDKLLSTYDELITGIDGNEKIDVKINIDWQVYWSDGLNAISENYFDIGHEQGRIDRLIESKRKRYENKIHAFNRKLERLAKKHKIHPSDIYKYLDERI